MYFPLCFYLFSCIKKREKKIQSFMTVCIRILKWIKIITFMFIFALLQFCGPLVNIQNNFFFKLFFFFFFFLLHVLDKYWNFRNWIRGGESCWALRSLQRRSLWFWPPVEFFIFYIKKRNKEKIWFSWKIENLFDRTQHEYANQTIGWRSKEKESENQPRRMKRPCCWRRNRSNRLSSVWDWI